MLIRALFCVRKFPRACTNEGNKLKSCFVTRTNYSTDPSILPTTCPGLNYKKTGDEVPLKPDSEYPDWLWSLGGPKKAIQEMSFETDGKTYTRRLRKMKLRENNMIRKQRRF